ncbi:MAG: SurA N-terminal domain-containing protein [Pseudomonadota bacterium]
MLSTLRKHSRSFIIYIFFGIIIAVFVVSFGPQSAGITSAPTDAASIDGIPVRLNDFSYALAISGIRNRLAEEEVMIHLRGQVMDQLLIRTLMADEARKLGMRIPDQEIRDMLFKGRYLALGQPRPLIRGEDNKFDYDLFARFVRFQWGLSVKKFKHQQSEELLAEKFREYLRSMVKVSFDEVKADYVHKNTQSTLHYVRFQPKDFEDQVQVDEKTLETFIAKNLDKVKKAFEANHPEKDKKENKTAAFGKAKNDIARKMLVELETSKLAQATAEGYVIRALAGEKLEEMFAVENTAEPSAENTDEPKPTMKDPAKPFGLLTTDPFSRSGRWLVPGIGISKEITEAAFKLKTGEVSSQPFKVGNVIYLVACKDRTDPDMKEWEKNKEEIMEEISIQRWREIAVGYAKKRCTDALKNNQIRIRMAVIAPRSVNTKTPQQVPYTPCASLDSYM